MLYRSVYKTKGKEAKKDMKIYYKNLYVGMVEANEYTVKELQLAGFTVIIE